MGLKFKSSIHKLLLIFVFCFGCSAVPYHQPLPEIKDKEWERPTTKALLPVSLAAAYFGTFGTHEGGHALSAELYGARSIDVSVLPGHQDDGSIHLGYTSAIFSKPLNSTADTLLDIAGPGAAFAGEITGRELLKTGYIPLVLQSSLQWYSLICKTQFYGEIMLGLCRVKTADFGKTPVWIPLTMGLAGIIYDVWDLGFCDNPDRYFRCLIGEAFYYTKSEQKSWFAYLSPSKNGAEIAIVWQFK